MNDDASHMRTHLANERTLLAYIRTGLGFFASGLATLGLFEGRGFDLAGFGFMGTGVLVLIIGVIRFSKVKRSTPHKG